MSAVLVLLLAVGAAYFTAHVAFDWLARRFLLVSGVEYLVLGLLLGPHVSGILSGSLVDSLAPVSTLAIGWVGAVIGAELDLRHLVTLRARPFRIGLAESLLVGAFVGGLEYLALRWTGDLGDHAAVVASVVLAGLAMSSSRIPISLVRGELSRETAVLEQMDIAAVTNALVSITVIALAYAIWHDPAPLSRPLTSTEWMVITMALGVVGGLLFHVFLGDAPDPDLLFVALVGGVVLVSGGATYVHVSPLFAAACFGATLVNSTRDPAPLVALLHRVQRPFFLVLLLFAGAAWTPSRLEWVGPVALFVVARAAGTLGGTRLAARANAASAELGPHWGRGLLGQGWLTLALGLSYLHQPGFPYRYLVFSATIASVLFTDVMSARWVRAGLGLGAPEPEPGTSVPGGSA